MSNPDIFGLLIEQTSDFDALSSSRVIIKCIESLSAISGGYHMNDLIVAVIAQIDLIPSRIAALQDLPILGLQIGHWIHCAPVIDHYTVLILLRVVEADRFVYCVLDLEQRFEQTFLEIKR